MSLTVGTRMLRPRDGARGKVRQVFTEIGACKYNVEEPRIVFDVVIDATLLVEKEDEAEWEPE